MLFNSIEFGIFLPIVFLLYWAIGSSKIKEQNILLLIASYVFYGWWNWRFLSLIVISSSVDFLIGRGLAKTDNERNRRLLLFVSIGVNLGILGFFKYYNFFIENFSQAFTLFGSHIQPTQLKIILPVGISFYTFQTLSYSIDVYRRKIEPTRDIINFFSFVSFFPQLVAGPIERASNLLPQFSIKREFKYEFAVDGMRQMLWGLFKKVVIADNAAIYANDIFMNFHDYHGSTLFIGAAFFAIQIYGDFSGYSDIAIGVAKLFGFTLMQNFNFPYFSRDIAEFWRRWHISLTTWFRDYVYIPLGGSRVRKIRIIRNILIIFVVSGFWHGANWTFIIWGLLNAVYFIPLLIAGKNRKNTNTIAEGRILPSIKEIFQLIVTFTLTLIAWVFFRSASISDALDFLSGMFSGSFFKSPLRDLWTINTGNHIIYLSIMIFLFVIVEWLQREKKHGLEISVYKLPAYIRWGIYYSVIFACFIMNGIQQEFIYFQF